MDTERFDWPPDSPRARRTVLKFTTVREDAQRIQLRFSGEIDLSSSDLVEAAVCDALRADHSREIEVDLAEVRFLDSSGIHALLRCRMAANRAGRQLSVTNVQPIVYRVLEIGGVVTVLSITPVRDQPIDS